MVTGSKVLGSVPGSGSGCVSGQPLATSIVRAVIQPVAASPSVMSAANVGNLIGLTPRISHDEQCAPNSRLKLKRHRALVIGSIRSLDSRCFIVRRGKPRRQTKSRRRIDPLQAPECKEVTRECVGAGESEEWQEMLRRRESNPRNLHNR